MAFTGSLYSDASHIHDHLTEFVTMSLFARTSLAATLLFSLGAAQATGLATCDSGPKSGWQASSKLEEQLKAKGYTCLLYTSPSPRD